MLLLTLALGNQDETGQSRFGGQQVIEARIELLFNGVIADGEQLPAFVKEKRKIDVCKLLALTGNKLDLSNSLGRITRRVNECL